MFRSVLYLLRQKVGALKRDVWVQPCEADAALGAVDSGTPSRPLFQLEVSNFFAPCAGIVAGTRPSEIQELTQCFTLIDQ